MTDNSRETRPRYTNLSILQAWVHPVGMSVGACVSVWCHVGVCVCVCRGDDGDLPPSIPTYYFGSFSCHLSTLRVGCSWACWQLELYTSIMYNSLFHHSRVILSTLFAPTFSSPQRSTPTLTACTPSYKRSSRLWREFRCSQHEVSGFESILLLHLVVYNSALVSHSGYNHGVRSMSFIVTTCPL